MPANHSHSSPRALRRWLLLGASLALIGGGIGWWMHSSPAAIKPDLAEPTLSPTIPKVESPAAMAPLAPEARQALGGNSGEPETIASQPDADLILRGRVVPNLPLPNDESLVAVVEAWFHAKYVLALATEDSPEKWAAVARVALRPDGMFEAPLPRGAKVIRVVVDGDYVYDNSFEFDVGEELHPGTDRLELPVGVGAHMTVDFDFGGTASAHEIASLAGKHVAFDSIGPRDRGTAPSAWRRKALVVLGPHGRAELRGVRPIDWALPQGTAQSTDEGLAPFRVAATVRVQPEPGQRLQVTVPIERGKPLSGYVRDAEGQPISSAFIDIEDRLPSTLEAFKTRRPIHESQATNVDGYFQFPSLPDDVGRLTIRSTGFLNYELGRDELVRLLETPGPHDFVLDPGNSLKVMVKAADGEPAVGVTVVMTSPEAGQLPNVRTGDDGIALLQSIPDGDYSLQAVGQLRDLGKRSPIGMSRYWPVRDARQQPVSATDPHQSSLWAASQDIPASVIASGRTVHLQLQPVPMIRGQVIGVDPAWAGRISVVAVRKGKRRRGLAAIMGLPSSFTIDQETGTFEGQLTPGSYDAQAVLAPELTHQKVTSDPPKVRRSNLIEFEVGTEDVYLSLNFAASLGLSGSTRLRNGAPVSGIEVQLNLQGRPYYDAVDTAKTDSLGGFTFDGLTPGVYEVRIMSPRYVAAPALGLRVMERLSHDAVELVVEAAGALRIEARNLAGEIDPHALVGILDENGKRITARTVRGDSEWAGARGPLPQGTYIVDWYHNSESGARHIQRHRAEVEAGKLTTLRIQEAPKGQSSLEGRITSGGAPAPGVAVELSSELGLGFFGVTDASGNFRLEGLVPGTMTLAAGASRNDMAAERKIKIAAGATAAADLALPTGAIEGTMAPPIDADGGTSGFVEAVVRRQGDAPSKGPFRRSTGSDTGNFTIPYLPDGTYELYVAGRFFGQREEWKPQTIRIENGQRVRGAQIQLRH